MKRKPKVHKLLYIGPSWEDGYTTECWRRVYDHLAVRKTWKGVTCKNCLRRKASYEAETEGA